MGDAALLAQCFRVFAVDVIGEPGLSAPSRPPLYSDAYALWLDDVMSALRLDQASFVGVSLGGWLALDYATRRPTRVNQLALVCPGGVGRQKIAILFKIAFFNLCGSWGMRKLRDTILGPMTKADVSPAMRKFGEFFALIHEGTRPRKERLPVFSDRALKALTMPVLAIVGAKDVLLDSADTRRRIHRLLEKGDVRYIDDAGHFIPGQGTTVREFLSCGLSGTRSSTSPTG
jgi:pimeloyl-ACP methyl ester carboxylesterase